MTNIMIVHHLNEQQRYVLSVILSYLNENEGTSFLITNKVWSRRILPLFQLPAHLIVAEKSALALASSNSSTSTSANQIIRTSNTNDNGSASKNHVRKIKTVRHRFAVMPIQDSHVLLEKLNTKRLAMRIRKRNSRKTKTSKLTEDAHDDKHAGGMNIACCSDSNHQTMNTADDNDECYPLNLSTDEIAWYEWNQFRMLYLQKSMSKTNSKRSSQSKSSNSSSNSNNNQSNQYSIQDHSQQLSVQSLSPSSSSASPWDAKLELLRYRTPPKSYKIPKQIRLSSNSIHLPPKLLPQTTLLTSYPRSGNTLLRNLIERITNIITGSDTRPDRTLSKSLALHHNLIGEGITQSKFTPVIKTHYPERKGYMPYHAHRIILLVRNPYDAIDSYWNMCCTNTHTESVVEDIYDLYHERFENLAKSEIGTWLKFVKYWLCKGNSVFADESLDQKKDGFLPPSLLVIRFEDLVLKTESVMTKVLSFMLDGDGDGASTASKENGDIHPYWKWRIKHGLDLLQHESKCDSSADKSSSPPTCKSPSNNKDNCSISGNQDACVIELNRGVNTLQLGSYTPRSEQRNSLAAIGKSIRKQRYSKDVLSTFENMSNHDEHLLELHGQKFNILDLFGYDISSQNFPFNIDTADTSKCWNMNQFLLKKVSSSSTQSGVRVNVGPELRLQSSEFGRAMTNWRKSQTDNDMNPFPTVNKKSIN
jgi:hypothetical protein